MSESEAIRWLRRLVAIPSVNPALGKDVEICGERRVAQCLAKALAEKGFEIAWEGKEARPNVVATFGKPDAARTLLIEGHTDTVGVEGMREPFRARIEKGRLYGRGACDDKGPLAAGLCALSRPLLKRLSQAGWRVIFAAVMGEETGNEGATRLVRSGLRADWAVVLEPTGLAVIHAHKGALWLEIEVRGVAAHGSSPESGVNAVRGMVDVMHGLEELIAADRARRRDPLLGRPTLSFGTMQGGTAVNVVPDRCVLQIDRRTLPGERVDDILDRVRRVLERVQRRGRIRGYDIRVMKAAAPFSTSPESGLVRALEAACGEAGVKPERGGAAWFSDAGVLAGACKEVVVFGPGDIRQAHTTEEYIDLDSLEAGCNVWRRFLERLARGGA